MGTQTKTWQRRVLDAARRNNYAGLYWFVEMALPGRTHASAAHPGKFVPVIPVAPDPETSRHWAHMLAELFKASNSPTVAFDPALTAIDVLEGSGIPFYEFGEPVIVDVVCAQCAGVGQTDAELLMLSPSWLCEVCAEGERDRTNQPGSVAGTGKRECVLAEPEAS